MCNLRFKPRLLDRIKNCLVERFNSVYVSSSTKMQYNCQNWGLISQIISFFCIMVYRAATFFFCSTYWCLVSMGGDCKYDYLSNVRGHNWVIFYFILDFSEPVIDIEVSYKYNCSFKEYEESLEIGVWTPFLTVMAKPEMRLKERIACSLRCFRKD